MEDYPRTLGWAPGPVDERDHALASFLTRPALQGEKAWGWGGMPDLNQLKEGACTSFAIGNSVNCEPRRQNIESEYCFESYHATTEHDEFPDNWSSGQTGTSLRSAMKEWRRRGVLNGYAFSYSVEEVVSWVLTIGPVCIGVEWWSGMDDPARENGWFIEPAGSVRGRHAICVPRVHWGMGDENWVGVLNSWGRENWGNNGRARISEDAFRTLLEGDQYATAIAAVD